MEPHSYECGNKEGITLRGAKFAMLQWSRTLTSAEIAHKPRLGDAHLCGLQWSRTLTSAEISYLIPHSICAGIASMEPHSYECGNLFYLALDYTGGPRFNGAALLRVRKLTYLFLNGSLLTWLQWSRTLTSAEIGELWLTDKTIDKLQWSRTLTSAEIVCPRCPRA